MTFRPVLCRYTSAGQRAIYAAVTTPMEKDSHVLHATL